MPASASRSSGDLLADRRFAYAMAAKEEGDLAACADLIRQALEIAPGWAAAWFALGEAEAARGAPAAAAAAFREALRLDPADMLGAGLRLARLGKGKAEGAMTPAYVAALFDDYAARFDEALRGRLAYRGPEQLLDAVRDAAAARGRAPRFARMLDLGCGTGLAGEVFRGLVDVLEGVDLSRQMIVEARQKGLYDRLVVDDLGAFLARGREEATDLVVAADVFVYCADLQPILGQARRALAPGGLLAFTVETHGGEGVVLGEGLRYAHAEPLVRRLLDAAGFDVALCEAASSRRERQRPVPGLVVVAAGRRGPQPPACSAPASGTR